MKSANRYFAIVATAALTVMIGCTSRTVGQNHAAPAPPGREAVAGAVGNWPLFRGNAQSTGVAQSTLPQDLQLHWKYSVDNGAFEATPIVVDGIAYIGDLDGTLYAIDLQSGDVRWMFANPAEKVGFNAAAAVRDGLLYIGDMEGNFYCIDLASHEKKWAAKAEGEIDSAANFFGDKVLFGSQDTKLYCYNAKTGEQAWVHPIADQIRCSPTVVEDRCFVAGCDGKLHVIDLNNGQEVGAVEIDGPTGCTPAAAGDRIYFGTEGPTFFCINWKEATEVWHWRDQARGGMPIRSSAALTPTAVVFGARDKKVRSLDPKSGDRQWEFPTKGRVDGSPVVVGDRVYVGSADGRVYGLSLAKGEKLWEYEAGGSFIGSPAVADGRLVIASDAGVVYCFGEKK